MQIKHRGSHKGFVPSINVWRYPYFRVSGMNQQQATIHFEKWIKMLTEIIENGFIYDGREYPILNQVQNLAQDNEILNKMQAFNLSDDFNILANTRFDEPGFEFLLNPIYETIN